MKNCLLISLLALCLFTPAADGGETVKIGYSCSDVGDTFQGYVMDAARKQAEASDVGFVVMDAAEDKDLQLRQVETMLADKVAALVVVPVNTSEVDGIVAAAAKAETPTPASARPTTASSSVPTPMSRAKRRCTTPAR